MQRPLIDSATLLMGDSGTGKTSLIATFARYVWKKYKKITLVYSTDAGGVGQQMKALIDIGVVRLWRMGNRLEVPETMSLATQGWWPKELDVQTAVADPRVELVGPTLDTLRMFCPNGHLVIEAKYEAQLVSRSCSECKVLTAKSVAGVVITRSSILAPWAEQVGAVCYDGLTSMEESVMSYLELQGITGAGGVSKSASVVKSGTMQYGQNSQAHFGFAQNRVPEWIKNSLKIPFLWAPPLFTSHELKIAGDEKTNAGLPFYGPKIAGNARTGDIPKLIGNCLGTATATDAKSGQTEWRLYLQQYRGADNIPHLCKNRAKSIKAFKDLAPEGYMADKPGEQEFSRFNLGVFYDALEAALELEKKAAAAEFPDAPGVYSGKISGEGNGPVGDERPVGAGGDDSGVNDPGSGDRAVGPGGGDPVVPTTQAAGAPTQAPVAAAPRTAPAGVPAAPAGQPKTQTAAVPKGAPPVRGPMRAPVSIKKTS